MGKLADSEREKKKINNTNFRMDEGIIKGIKKKQ